MMPQQVGLTLKLFYLSCDELTACPGRTRCSECQLGSAPALRFQEVMDSGWNERTLYKRCWSFDLFNLIFSGE